MSLVADEHLQEFADTGSGRCGDPQDLPTAQHHLGARVDEAGLLALPDRAVVAGDGGQARPRQVTRGCLEVAQSRRSWVDAGRI